MKRIGLCSKNDKQSFSLRGCATKYKNDKNDAVNYLESFTRNTRINSKLLLHNSLIILFKSCISGVCREHVEDFNKLISSVTELIWYVSPQHSTFQSHSAAIPKFFSHLLLFNDPNRHRHKGPNVSRETLMKLVGVVTTCLENSYTTKNSFKNVYQPTDQLIECCVKYSDYLEKNLNAVVNYQTHEEPQYKKTVISLPCLKEPLASKYKSEKELTVIESIEDKLDNLDFFEHLCLTELRKSSSSHFS